MCRVERVDSCTRLGLLRGFWGKRPVSGFVARTACVGRSSAGCWVAPWWVQGLVPLRSSWSMAVATDCRCLQVVSMQQLVRGEEEVSVDVACHFRRHCDSHPQSKEAMMHHNPCFLCDLCHSFHQKATTIKKARFFFNRWEGFVTLDRG